MDSRFGDLVPGNNSPPIPSTQTQAQILDSQEMLSPQRLTPSLFASQSQIHEYHSQPNSQNPSQVLADGWLTGHNESSNYQNLIDLSSSQAVPSLSLIPVSQPLSQSAPPQGWNPQPAPPQPQPAPQFAPQFAPQPSPAHQPPQPLQPQPPQQLGLQFHVGQDTLGQPAFHVPVPPARNPGRSAGVRNGAAGRKKSRNQGQNASLSRHRSWEASLNTATSTEVAQVGQMVQNVGQMTQRALQHFMAETKERMDHLEMNVRTDTRQFVDRRMSDLEVTLQKSLAESISEAISKRMERQFSDWQRDLHQRFGDVKRDLTALNDEVKVLSDQVGRSCASRNPPSPIPSTFVPLLNSTSVWSNSPEADDKGQCHLPQPAFVDHNAFSCKQEPVGIGPDGDCHSITDDPDKTRLEENVGVPLPNKAKVTTSSRPAASDLGVRNLTLSATRNSTTSNLSISSKKRLKRKLLLPNS